MADRELDGFQKIAAELFELEKRARPGLRKGSRAFQDECLAVIAGYLRREAAPYKGRRYATHRGKRKPVMDIARSKAAYQFDGYLKTRNIPQREVITPGVQEDGPEAHADDRLPDQAVEVGRNLDCLRSETYDRDDSVAAGATAAVPLSREDAGESGHVTEFRSNRTRGVAPGMSEGSRSMARPAATWGSGQHFLHGPVTLLQWDGGMLTVPRMPWQRGQEIVRAWRRLRGELYGPVSLLDANLEQLYNLPGTEVVRLRLRRTFRLAARSLVEAA